MYNRLLQYRDEVGDCLVPFNFKNDPQLGWWVHWQRRNQGSLSAERKGTLESIGFVWKLRKKEAWDDLFERLVKYHKANGNCLVPLHYEADRKLGKWVEQQRVGKDSLTVERKRELDRINFVWVLNEIKDKGKTILPEEDTVSGSNKKEERSTTPSPDITAV